MLLGTAKNSITPQTPLRLCGYASRTKTFDGVKEDIYVRAHWHQCNCKDALFLYGDLIWWGADFIAPLRQKLVDRYGLRPDSIFFAASHNHSGPPTGARFTPQLETFDEKYAKWLGEKVLLTAQQAKEDLEPVSVRRFDKRAALNVFRRVVTPDGVEMRPNYQVAADHALTVLTYRRQDGGLKAYLLHYPCHANLSDGNDIHPDYPGIALRMLDEENPGSVSMFLQGCTADLRPNSVLGARFIPQAYENVVRFAQDFADCVKAAERDEGQAVEPDFTIEHTTVELPLEHLLSNREVAERTRSGDALTRQWAEAVTVSGNKPYEELELSCFRYAPQFCLFTLGAEVSQYYAAYARSFAPQAVCAAYTNGMVGYLCTGQQIREGGYEPKESAQYFALAGTYTPEIETLIRQNMFSLYKKTGQTVKEAIQ